MFPPSQAPPSLMADNAHVASFPQWSSVRSTTVDFVREFFDFTGDNALPFTPTEHDVRIEREQVGVLRARRPQGPTA